MILTLVRLALIHVLQLASKAGASLSGEFVVKRGTRIIIIIMPPLSSDRFVLFLQSIRRLLLISKSIEIGNADVAANVLGCAAKVPSLSFSRLRFRWQ